MLDVAFLRQNLEAVKTNCRNRNVNADVDRVIALDDQRKQFATQRQTIQQRQNELSKLMKDPDKRATLAAEAKQLREQVGDIEKQEKQVEEELRTAVMLIPNMTHPDAPVGQT